MILTVAIVGVAALGFIIYHLYRLARLSPRERWLRRYDQRLKKNHPFFS